MFTLEFVMLPLTEGAIVKCPTSAVGTKPHELRAKKHSLAAKATRNLPVLEKETDPLIRY